MFEQIGKQLTEDDVKIVMGLLKKEMERLAGKLEQSHIEGVAANIAQKPHS